MAAIHSDPILRAEFLDRFVHLSLTSNGYPKKARDRQIVLRSATRALSLEASYDERSLNECLRVWCAGVGAPFELDHVTIRRYLVDAGLLTREATGANYQLSAVSRDSRAEIPSFAQLEKVVADGRTALLEKKRQFLKRND